MDSCEIIDISPSIHPGLAVYPGDVPFERRIAGSFADGQNYLVSNIHSTLHLGAHADAPNHYHVDGCGIDQRDLSYYIGSAQVIEVSLERGERIYPKDIADKAIIAERVLFKTKSFPNPESWNTDYNALSPELVTYLADKKVRLIGIDTPSVDLDDDKELLSHTRIYENDIANLEGLRLDHGSEGTYQLVALPLKIKDADASPVRAVLLRDKA